MKQNDILSPLGPLASLYSDPDIHEIIIDSPDHVYTEKDGKLALTGITFPSAEAFRAAIEGTLALGGVKFSPDQTIGDARLPDGSRVLVVLPPTAISGPYMVLRKMVIPNLTWEMLFEFGSITPEAYQLLESGIHAPVNFLISGGTGSGKTTLANLLAERIPPDERIVIVEGEFELQIRHPRAISLGVGGSEDLSMVDLISTAAKMRPDWLVIGELLGPEAARAMQVLSIGHNGITTIHATSVEDALSRLEAMCLMANLGLGLSEIRVLITSAIQLITQQDKLPSGKRRVTQIVELCGLDNNRYVLQPLYRYNFETGILEPTGAKPGW